MTEPAHDEAEALSRLNRLLVEALRRLANEGHIDEAAGSPVEANLRCGTSPRAKPSGSTGPTLHNGRHRNARKIVKQWSIMGRDCHA